MAELLTLIPMPVQEKESVDRVMKELNEAHAAGRLTHICAATIENRDEYFTYVTNMRSSDMAYCIEWLKLKLHQNMRADDEP
jgi:hypothetical protein